MTDNNYETKDLPDKKIAKAQKWLRNEGSNIKVTGKFTIGMTTVLCKFQRENKLPVTGTLDKDTWRLLKKKNPWYKNLLVRK